MSGRRWADVPIEELKQEVYSRNGNFQRMISFLAMAPLPAFLKDRGGRVIYMNTRAELLWHVAIDDVRGRTMTEVMHLNETERRVAERQDNKVLAGIEACIYMETVSHSESRVRRFSVLKFPLKDDNGEVLLVALVLPHNP